MQCHCGAAGRRPQPSKKTALEQGTATYETDGNSISNVVTAYDSTGSAGGQSVTIDLAWLASASATGGTVAYACDDANMSWTGNYPVPILFTRVDS